MMFTTILLIAFSFWANAVDSEAKCFGDEQGAAYECLKLADKLSESGNQTAATKYYVMACKKGLSAACRDIDVKALTSNHTSDSSSVEDQLSSLEKKAAGLIKRCSTGEIKSKQCVSEAKAIGSKDPELELLMLESFCNQHEDSDSCRAYGAINVRIKRYDDAVAAYMKACAQGDQVSCSMLQAAQKQIELAQIQEGTEVERAKLKVENSRFEHEQRKAKVDQYLQMLQISETSKIGKAIESGNNRKSSCTTERQYGKLVTSCSNNSGGF